MRKILSVLLILALTASLFCIAPAAEEAVDAEIVRVANYSGSYSAEIWLCQYDDEDMCIGNAYVVFNAAAPFTKIAIPEFYAGTSAKGQDADVRLELFSYDTDDETTLKGTPVFKKEHHMDGDIKEYEVVFDQTCPAGQYLFRVTQFGDRGDEATIGRYTVLPRATKWLYSDSSIGSGPRGQFAFAVDFVKTEGVETYFKTLQGQDLELEPLQAVSEYIGGTAKSINAAGEFVIVTPEIPAERVLYSFTLTLCPTWGNTNGDSDLCFEVYKWLGDYSSSVDNGLLYEGEILDHQDNSDLTINLNTTCRYGNRYMLILTAPEGNVGYYMGSSEIPEGWEFYEGDNEAEFTPACAVTYAVVGDLGPEPTTPPKVTAAPAPTDDVPSEDATEDPGEVITTLPPKDSDNKDTEKKDGGSSPLPVIIGIAAAVIIAAAVAVIVIKKRKK